MCTQPTVTGISNFQDVTVRGFPKGKNSMLFCHTQQKSADPDGGLQTLSQSKQPGFDSEQCTQQMSKNIKPMENEGRRKWQDKSRQSKRNA